MKALAVAAALAVASLVQANPTKTNPEQPNKRGSLPTVTPSGNAFFAGSTRFYVRGIDYQPGGSSNLADPLADTTVCNRDIAEFTKLGVNTIRVYTIDNSKNHDACMTALAAAGIYLILDVNNPYYSLNRDNPQESYNTAYLQSIFATIDEFVKYDNTLAFFSGNEVINATSTSVAPYVKAVTRDMRQYIGNRGYRPVPVGYSAADISSNRMQLAAYMNCGTDDERSDFFAFNDYSWCNTDFATSGWDQKVKNFTGYGIPIFLSEYGCITNGRDFGEVAALMNPEMTSVYSGGLMYEYSLEPNNFGIVDLSSGSAKELPGFAKFEKALSANPAPTGNGGFTSTSAATACPTSDSNWGVQGTLLPAMPDQAKQYFSAGAGAGPGLVKPGSQNRADTGTSTGSAAPGSGSVTGHRNVGARPAPPLDKSPLYICALVGALTLAGAILL